MFFQKRPAPSIKPGMPLVTFIPRAPDIRSPTYQNQRYNLHEEPTPPTSLPSLPLHPRTRLLPPLIRVYLHPCSLCRLRFIEILRFHGDDVEVVGKLAGFGAEAEVGHGGDGDGGGLEAEGPFLGGFVLEFEFEGLVLEIGEAGLGGDAGAADASGLVDKGGVSQLE